MRLQMLSSSVILSSNSSASASWLLSSQLMASSIAYSMRFLSSVPSLEAILSSFYIMCRPALMLTIRFRLMVQTRIELWCCSRPWEWYGSPSSLRHYIATYNIMCCCMDAAFMLKRWAWPSSPTSMCYNTSCIVGYDNTVALTRCNITAGL
jgi:hypothetical protein